MKLSDFIKEAAPRAADRNKIYYHGTSTEKAAKQILKEGLDPAATVVKYGTRKSALRPEDASVYITPDLSYAMIYGIGGQLFGTSYNFTRDIESMGEYGFVFEIPGSELVEIGPDEDSVGEMIYKFAHGKIPESDVNYSSMRTFVGWAKTKLTDGQWAKCIEGDYAGWASSGKKLNKLMTDSQKMLLIDSGAHISHKGLLMPSKCWRFSRKDAKEIKADGSNFFEYATEVKSL